MRTIALATCVALAACGQEAAEYEPHPSPLRVDCRPTGGDGTICTVGSDAEAACIIFHEDDRGKLTELRRDVPRPDVGCLWDGYLARDRTSTPTAPAPLGSGQE